MPAWPRQLCTRLANPTPIPDGGGGLAAALNAVALKCAEEAKLLDLGQLDERLSCRIDVVAFAGAALA